MLAAPATYTIRRYPATLIDRVTLRDGRSVIVRPVLPQDEDIARSFVRHLSPESRHSRFLAGLSDLSPRMLAYLTHVDYEHHLALIAETVDDDVEVQVGEARYVVDDDGRNADFAIAVDDDWQRAGLGGTLLVALERAAKSAGIKGLHGDVLVGNRKALAFMRRHGFIVVANPEDAYLVRVTKRL